MLWGFTQGAEWANTSVPFHCKVKTSRGMVPWRHLAGLQLLITSSKALSTLMYTFVLNIPSFLWASIAGQYKSFVFSFFSGYQNGFWESVPFYIPTHSVVIFSNNWPALNVSSWSLFLSHCDRCVVASHYLIHGFGWVPQRLVILMGMADELHIIFDEISLYVLSML